jgi:Uma2 family endonuclease
MADLKTLDLDQLIHDRGARLEITGGVPTWEASPGTRHQRLIDRIRASIAPLPESDEGCACDHLSDVYIRFPDGSLKRPDVAIFCEAPPDVDEALEMVPQAVIEIISPGYEYKDVVLNPQFYLSQGVGDVVIVDPRSGAVTHYRGAGVANLYAPVTIELLCGCSCMIP